MTAIVRHRDYAQSHIRGVTGLKLDQETEGRHGLVKIRFRNLPKVFRSIVFSTTPSSGRIVIAVRITSAL